MTIQFSSANKESTCSQILWSYSEEENSWEIKRFHLSVLFSLLVSEGSDWKALNNSSK